MTGSEAVKRFQARMYGIGKMTGNVSFTGQSGQTFSGNFKFMAPGKFYIKFSNPSGRVIVSNGNKLWVYNKASNVCGIQDLGSSLSGGIAGMVSGYNAIVTSRSSSGYTIKLRNNDKAYPQIILRVSKSFLLRKAIFKTKDGKGFSFVLSNINTSAGVHSSLFNFSVPPNVQSVINPLNIR